MDASSKLEQAIANRLPDTGSNSHIGYAEDISTKNNLALASVFTDHDVNLDPREQYQRMQLRSKIDKTVSRYPTYDASYNTGRGVIVVNDMDKREDAWPTDNPNNVKISDMMAQVYRQFGGNLKDLRFVIQNSILNQGTLHILETIYQDMGTTKYDTVGIFSRPAVGATDHEAQAFNALLGSDNVRPTVYMLTDHHGEAGGKRVQRILTFPPGTTDNFVWHMAIILG